MLVRHLLLCCVTLTSLIIGRPEQAQACVQIMPGVCFHTRSVFTGGYAPGSVSKKSSQPVTSFSAPRSSTGDTIVGVLKALIGTQKDNWYAKGIGDFKAIISSNVWKASL